MAEAYMRSKELINRYLNFINLIKEEKYPQILTINRLLELKSILSSINNIMTLLATLATANKISEVLSFNEIQKQDLLSSIEKKNANTNGFDIQINTPNKILIEVKCNMPIQGKQLGQQQINSILDDAIKLRNDPPKRKKINIDTSDYIKIIVLVNVYPEKQDVIIRQITKEVKYKENTREERKQRMAIKKHIKPLQSLSVIKDVNDFKYIYLTSISLGDMENELQNIISK